MSNTLKIGQLPTAYHVIKYPNHEKNKDLILEMIKNADGHSVDDDWTKMKMTDLGINVQRTYFDKTIHDEFQNLFENFIEYWNKEQGCPNWINMIYDFWYCEYEKGDFVKWHTHPLSTMCAIYYLKLPDPQDVVSFKTWDGDYYIPKIEEGDILFFPSMQVHSALCTTDEGKVSINFNLKAGFDDVYAQEVKQVLDEQEKGENITIESI
jgi:hypothetical protein